MSNPMAKATKTIKQPLSYKSAHAPYFAATKVLFNQVAAFYFEVIQAHPGILDLSSKDALTALETLTHSTKDNPRPVKSYTVLGSDSWEGSVRRVGAYEIPALRRRGRE